MELLWRVELENGATVTGSTLMQPGENRIYAEILSEKDVQLMAFSLELTTPFTPVLNDTKK